MKSMSDTVKLHYDVAGDDFSTAGIASSMVKKELKKAGFPPEVIRKVSVSMYEGEINMIIHAGGGIADVEIGDEVISILLKDEGPGIADIELAMQEGWSTAPESIRALGFGAGMGLPNMKKYSDDFQIASEVGKGTTVRMHIYVK